MRGMDAKEALNCISKKSGLPEEIVRRVQKAETDYVIEEISKGNRANLPGRGTFRPDIRSKLMVGGSLGKYIKPLFMVSSIIENGLSDLQDFKPDDVEDDLDDIDGVLLTQLPSLQ